ncbi:Ig-like domain-containing protein (plasmid) [Deinococcus sp. KNUC1210]|uniref:Ig-like domain-containing protein n=1 Tax=Deinococcus sp. KNUC1210 TaxID=2917691 RepID=UPI001EEFD607|nr:Ig-like domain-containing protein [Deinococcus sp. KNUC1210]ULH13962.1 Ig-like domain-containing protein [Deinococcus sp. KNUC1210]
MKMTLFTLSLSVLLLADCVNAGSTATLSTLILSGIGNAILIGAPAKLAVTSTGSDGKPYAGTPTFTSSDPNIVSVSADGTLTVKHLNVKPVTLTVTEDGKSAALKVETFGLDAAGGTFLNSRNGSAPGYVFMLGFRDVTGHPLADRVVFRIQGPAAFNHGEPILRSMNKGGTTPGSYAWESDASIPAVTGTYVASGLVGGVTYSKTFTIDAAQVQAIPSAVNVTFGASKYIATGTLPAGAPLVYGELYLADPGGDPEAAQPLGIVNYFEALPVTGEFSPPLASGRYFMVLFAQNYHDERPDEVFPDQINMAISTSRYVTVPAPSASNNRNHR